MQALVVVGPDNFKGAPRTAQCRIYRAGNLMSIARGKKQKKKTTHDHNPQHTTQQQEFTFATLRKCRKKKPKHVFHWFCLCLFCVCECIYFRGRRAKQGMPGTGLHAGYNFSSSFDVHVCVGERARPVPIATFDARAAAVRTCALVARASHLQRWSFTEKCLVLRISRISGRPQSWKADGGSSACRNES